MDDGFDFEDSLEATQPVPAQQVGGQTFQPSVGQPLQPQQQQPPHQAQQEQQQLMLHHQQQLLHQHRQQQQQQQQLQQPIRTPQPSSQNAIEPWRQRPADKKTVCVYWLKNNCHRGDNCGFLHQFDTARMPLCPNFRKFGSCTDADCPFKHSMDDLKDCNMYRLGFCVYGPNCRYRHDPLPGPPPPPESVEAARPRPIHQRFTHDFNSFGRGRGRFQPYAGPGRGMRPFQVHPPVQNGAQMIGAPPVQEQPVQ